MEQNGYWLSSFTTLDVLGWDPKRVLERKSRIDTLTRKNLRETIARYYPEEELTVITLLPEAGASESGSEEEGDAGSR